VANHSEDFTRIAPFAKEYKKMGNQATVYICENFACKQPTTNLEQALDELL